MLIKFEEKEFEKGGTLYKQNYKIFYTLNEKGQEIIKKEEPIEEESVKEIQTKEYFETKPEDSIIQKKRQSKLYPIEYSKIYYKEEVNTKRAQKEVIKTENILISIEHFVELVTKGKFQFKEEYDKEIFFVNGVRDENLCKSAPKSNFTSEKISKKVIQTLEETRNTKIGKTFRFFKKNEHIYKIEKRSKIIYDDGTFEYTDWLDGGIQIFDYDL